MKRDILIGGAWPYANYYLHVGHLSALLPGDILAKYYRIKKDNVIYVSGSDAHGTPITERAKKENKNPEEIAKFYHQEFVKTFNNMGFEYDLYASTMEDFHKDFVQESFIKLYNNKYLEEKLIPQDYCEKCEIFLSDREIIGKCPICKEEATGDQCDSCLNTFDASEVLEKRCKQCNNKTLTKENKHLYFKLSSFEKEIEKLITINEDKWRKNAVGESKKFLSLGLIDRAATRQLDWGIEVPIKGYEDKRIYVWFEAVLGYLSVCKKVCEEKNINFNEFISKENKNLTSYYVHGKDNIPFHTIIYPALLEGINKNYNLPNYIVSSAYVNLNDQKMSKSKGVLITVNELLEKFESDTIRFYFIFNGPETKDTNCTIEDIIAVHNKFLVGVLGNFINRNLSFINKKFDGKITKGIIDEEIRQETIKTYDKVSKLIEKAELKSALNLVIEYISLGNKYYDEKQPWIKIKENIEEFNNITYTCVYMIANIANLIAPILPDTSKKIKNMLDLKELKWKEEIIETDKQVKELKLLFERIE